jgi:dTDP-4-dehydrorhamnose 3,5-epimerase
MAGCFRKISEGDRRIMEQFVFEKTAIDGVLVITPNVHGDDRGYFMETYNENDMKEAGLDYVFVQDNQSASKKGVLRGLHFQKEFPQDKLVRVVNGEVFDVAVDLREGSATFGKWFGVLLSAENKKQFMIPKNFAHGFIVLSDYAEFCYKCTDFYHPNDEGGLLWKDPEIGVEWPMPEGMTEADLTLSDKDQKWSGIAAYKAERGL